MVILFSPGPADIYKIAWRIILPRVRNDPKGAVKNGLIVRAGSGSCPRHGHIVAGLAFEIRVRIC